MKKKTCAAALILFIFSGMGWTQSKEENVPPDSTTGNAPLIAVDKVVHDYGTIRQGDDGTCSFKVTNTGKSTLIISKCKGSCGCTVPTCPQKPIAPGASATIDVSYNTNRVGAIDKSVTITSNAANDPKKVIRIKGTVKPKPQGSAPLNNAGPVAN